MSDLIPWDEFIGSKEFVILKSAEPTQIACPKCGKRIYKRTDVILTCYPPKYSYFCSECGWTGYA